MAAWDAASGGAPGWDDGGAKGNWDTGATNGSTNNDNVDGDFNTPTATNGFGDNATDHGLANALAGNACLNCGQGYNVSVFVVDPTNNSSTEGHYARECPEPRKNGPSGACFNCGEEGHSKAECTQPRVFKGECRGCGQQDKAEDCPNRVIVCKNCLQEGHAALECKNPKAIDNSKVADKTEEEAWDMLETASNERDITDFKDAVKVLSKACPDYTYPQLERQFRKRGYKIYLIAMEKDHGDTWTNVNLQGEIEKKYAVGYYLSEKAQRPNLVEKWPTSPEENLERLADAGTPLDRGVEKCNNCNELGHTSRKCPQEKVTIERPTVSCALCGEEGHRVRDCTQERQKKREPRTCKNCGQEDHIAKDCPTRQKRACHKCGSEEHMAKDCDVIKCRNCDAEGHEARDCTAPKDWSRVKCKNCGEMGHTVKRCKAPIVEDLNSGGGGQDGAGYGDSGNAPAGGGTDNWEAGNKPTGSGQAGWETQEASAASAGANDGW